MAPPLDNYGLVIRGYARANFLLPGRRGLGPGGWAVQAKVTIYTWLGLLKHKKHYVDGLPTGYVESHELRNADRQTALPPAHIRYCDKHTFQLRAHVYQARSLIGSDASGLSDPFCRVLLNELSGATRVQDETLSPTWDELLVLEPLELYGSPVHIRDHPPQVVVEIFDQDQVGKAEFIGRCVAEPLVKLAGEPYARPRFPPALQWHELRRGPDRAGELLAAFELLQRTWVETIGN
ncbi:C2 domain containing protein [Gryllus bimaculatus]|nr:C2 domain containing protein [Gryllus bimaculatus]